MAPKKQTLSSAPDRGAKAREKLIDAGLELFGELGFVATSTRSIALKAGQNIAAINYYFGNKEGLYIAVLNECLLQKYAEDCADMGVAHTILEDPKAKPEQYLAAIKTLLHAKVLALAVQNKREKNFMKLVSREQFSPTKTFKNFFRDFNRTVVSLKQDAFTLLVAAYLNRAPEDTQTTLIVHALAGPYLGFMFTPEIVRIKTGWKTMGRDEMTIIADLLADQIEASLKSMRAKGKSS